MDIDTNYYIEKLDECQNKPIVLESCGYGNPRPKKIKGYMLDRFYTAEEYKRLERDIENKKWIIKKVMKHYCFDVIKLKKLIYLAKQLLPLTYHSRYRVQNGSKELAIWTQWFGKPFNIKRYTLAD